MADERPEPGPPVGRPGEDGGDGAPGPYPAPYGSEHGAPPPSSSPFGAPPDPGSFPQAAPTPPAVPEPPVYAGAPGPAPGPPPAAPPPWVAGQPWGVPPTGPPVMPVAPPPATKEQVRTAQRLGRLAILCAITAPLAGFVSLPYTLVLGFALAILAIVLGIRARRAAVVAQRTEAIGIIAIVGGSIALAFVAVMTGIFVLFWDEIREYQDCLSGANTRIAEQACLDRFSDQVLPGR